MFGGFQVGPFQINYQQVSGGQASTGAGRKRKKRYYIEIDGQRFEVSGPAEAQEVLAHARALAERAAEKAANQVIEKRKPEAKVRPVTLLPPRVSASPELEIDLAPLKQDLRKIYSNAAALAELQLLLKRAADDDDEDTWLLLM